ncbi:MAG: efflux RND transporter periplasmic adaptor subunit [Desulfobacteraceae bacterium]|jgi:RND family efflux transporter MFP subunit
MQLFKQFLKTYSIPGAACLIGTLALFLVSCDKKEEEVTKRKVVRPIKIMKITSSGEASKRRFPGRVRAAQRVDLAFQVGGPLIELNVDEGQEVKKGQLLARVDPRDFKTDVRNAEGQLARAKAALERANSEYNRILRIRKKDPGAASQSMVDRRREAVEKSKAEINALQATLDAAKLQLSYTYLRAPFSGVIATRHVENYQEVRRKQPVVTLDDLSHMEILVDVPEIVMATVRSGSVDPVAEFAPAPGKQYPLTIKEYSTRADPRTQTYRIVLTMPAPEDIRILPGMTATVTGKTLSLQMEEEGLFVVPALAVFSDESGASHVWVVDKETMKVQKRKVTTGDLTGTDSIQILSGLKPGEKIALTGVTLLREGMQVRDLGELEGYGR